MEGQETVRVVPPSRDRGEDTHHGQNVVSGAGEHDHNWTDEHIPQVSPLATLQSCTMNTEEDNHKHMKVLECLEM